MSPWNPQVKREPPPDKPRLYAQSHNGVDDVVIVLLQCLDGLVSRNACLGHDEFNILVLETFSINLLSIVLLIILLIIAGLDLLALAVGVAVGGVVVARVVMSGVIVLLLGSELLSSGSLSLGVEILNLGLTKDTEGFVRNYLGSLTYGASYM